MFSNIFWVPKSGDFTKLIKPFRQLVLSNFGCCKSFGHNFKQIGSQNETENWIRGGVDQFTRDTVLRLYKCTRCEKQEITRTYIDKQQTVNVDYDYLHNQKEKYKALFNEVSK